MNLTDEQKYGICDTLLHHADGMQMVMREFEDLEMEDIEEIALNENIERCKQCDWFVKSYDLLDDDDNNTEICSECRDE